MLRVGTRVEAQYNAEQGGTDYYPGKVHAVNADGSYAISYDDGDREFSVRAAFVRELAAPNTHDSDHMRRGTEVIVHGRQAHGQRGVIEAVGLHGEHFDVKLESGKLHREVPVAELQPAALAQKLVVGSLVEARYGGGTSFFPGSIQRICANGCYDMLYDDGDREQNVHWSMIRPNTSPSGNVGQKLQQLVTSAAQQGVDIVQSFKHFDKDGSGDLTRSELQQGLQELGLHANYEEMNWLMQKLDADGSGTVRIEEFARLLPTPPTQQPPPQGVGATVGQKLQQLVITAAERGVDIVQSFRHFDKDGSGDLTRQELSQGLEQLGLHATHHELSWIMGQLDADGDGTVSIQEFARLLPAAPPQQHGANQNNPPSRHRDDAQRGQAVPQGVGATVGQKLQQLVITAAERGVDIVQSFQHFDKDRSGDLTRQELSQGLEQLGLHATHHELSWIMGQLDADGDGTISIQEFSRLLPSSTLVEKLQKLVADAAERDFDKDRSGDVTKDELRLGLKQLGFAVVESDVNWLLQLLDTNNDGTIEIREFARLLPAAVSRRPQAPQVPQIDVSYNVGIKLQQLVIAATERGVDVLESFRHFDKDGSGNLTRVELDQGLRELGLHANPDELNWLMQQLDADGDGTVSVEEFSKLLPSTSLAQKLQQLVRDAERRGVDIVQAFAHFDTSSSGSVSRANFANGLTRLGFEFSTMEMDELIRALDTDNSGDISLEEFQRLLPPSPRANELEAFLKPLRELVQVAQQRGVDVRESFEHFDSNFDGYIAQDELRQGLELLGFRVERHHIDLLVATFAQAGSSAIEYHGFLRMIGVGESASTQETETLLIRLRALVAAAQGKGVSFDESFHHFDSNGDGILTRREFYDGLCKLGFTVTERETRLVMRRFENPVTNQIAYPEFVKMVSSDAMIEGLLTKLRQLVATAHDRGVDVRESFEHFDTNFDGAITKQELCEGLKKLNIDVTPEQEAKLVARFGTSAGVIDYYCFMSMVLPNQSGVDQKNARIVDLLERLRKLVQVAVEKGVTREDSFGHFDINKDGRISRAEFYQGMVNLKFEVSLEEARLIMRRFEDSSTREIPYRKFLDMLFPSNEQMLDALIDRLRGLIAKAVAKGVDYRQCFEHFDSDFSGLIDRGEFRVGLQRLDLPMNEAQIELIFDKFSKHSTVIKYEDFLKLIKPDNDVQSVQKIAQRLQLMIMRDAGGSESLREQFLLFDENKDGTISRREFRSAMASLGLKLTKRELHLLLAMLDTDADGSIDYLEFVNFVRPQGQVVEVQAILKRLRELIQSEAIRLGTMNDPFRNFDLNGDGVITRAEFKAGIVELGFRITPAEMVTLLDIFDMDGDGKINYSEFVKFVFPEDKSRPRPGRASRTDMLSRDLQEFVTQANQYDIPLEETFRCFDKNGDGVVSWDEFIAAIVELGFECTEGQLRKLMRRMDLDRDGFIDYREFLRYWSEERDASGKRVKRKDQQKKTLEEKVAALKRDLAKFIASAKRKGVSVGNIFRSFDRNEDGLISLDEFEQAMKKLRFECDREVLQVFLRELDVNDDGKIDYRDFLGLEIKHTSWKSVFGARRAARKTREHELFASNIVWMMVRRAEVEIETHGPMWKAARKALSARSNHGTFIQRNISAVKTREGAPISPQRQHHAAALAELEAAALSEAPVKKTLSLRRRIKAAERLHAAEEASARVAEDAALRAEQAAERVAEQAALVRAKRAAVRRLGNAVFFAGGERAAEFLQGIGLNRYGEAIKAVYVDGPGGSSDSTVSFPLALSGSMSEGENGTAEIDGLQSLLGTTSAIVLRKVRRELLALLEGNWSYLKDGGGGTVHPERWGVEEVVAFVRAAGVAEPSRFRRLGVDGESLLQLTFEEAKSELGVQDEIVAQRIVYRLSMLEYMFTALEGIRSSKERGKENTGSGANQSNSDPLRVYSSVEVGGRTILRPSKLPVKSWNVDEVVRFVESLDLPTEPFRSLAVDGEGLLELTGEDIELELGLRGTRRQLLLEAIDAVRQPPWVLLGTGPYLEVRVDAAIEADTNLQVQFARFYQWIRSMAWKHEREGVLCMAVQRQHSFWVHPKPALKRAVEITRRAIEIDTQAQRAAAGLIDKVAGAYDGDELMPKPRAIKEAERSLLAFLAQAQRGGINVLDTFRQYDVNSDDLVTWIDFEAALGVMGFRVDKGVLRAVLRRADKDTDGKINYKRFIENALQRSAFVSPVFALNCCDTSVALTTDGTMASLLHDKDGTVSKGAPSSIGQMLASSEACVGTRVRVMYHGGHTLYPGKIMHLNEDGSYDIEYDDGDTERNVPWDWIRAADAHAEIGDSRADETAAIHKVACAGDAFEAGIQTWDVKVHHSAQDVMVGVRAKSSNDESFIGYSSTGRFIGGVVELSNAVDKIDLSPPRFHAGDVITVRLDLDAGIVCFKLNGKAAGGPVTVRLAGDVEADNAETAVRSFIRKARARNLPFEELMRRYDPQATGFVRYKDLERTFVQLGYDGGGERLEFVARSYVDDKMDGKVDYRKFLSQRSASNARRGRPKFSPAACLRHVGDCVEFLRAGRKSTEAQPDLSTGTRVNVRYGGGSTFYPARVVLCNTDGTYAVDYDDGDHESSVLAKNIVVADEQDVVEEPFAPKLELRLFSKVLMYRCDKNDSLRRRVSGETTSRPRKGKVLTTSGHVTVPMDGFDHEISDTSTKTTTHVRHGKIDDLPRASTSFTDAGGIRFQDLMRKRLNRPHNVQWSHTNQALLSVFSPLAHGDSAIEHNKETDDGWHFLGSLHPTAGGKEWSRGVPMIVRFEQLPPDTAESGAQWYFRTCVMGVLGQINANGEFEPTVAPVIPTEAAVPAFKLRVGGGYEQERAPGDLAGRFFVFSPAYFVEKPTGKALKTTSIPGPKKKRKKKRRHVPSEHRSATTATSNFASNSAPQWTRSSSVPKGRHHRVKKDRGTAPTITVLDESDRRTIIDRWLAQQGLNEYGEAIGTSYPAGTPLIYTDPPIGRYDYILRLHPDQPWVAAAKIEGWIATDAEADAINDWLKRSGLNKFGDQVDENSGLGEEDENDPRRVGDQSTPLTRYEYLLRKNRQKPWLRPPDWEKESVPRKSSRRGVSRRDRSTGSPQHQRRVGGGFVHEGPRSPKGSRSGRHALPTRELVMPEAEGIAPKYARHQSHTNEHEIPAAHVRTSSRGPAGFKIGGNERSSTVDAKLHPSASIRPPWAESDVRQQQQEITNLREQNDGMSERVRASLQDLTKHELDVARVKAELALETSSQSLVRDEETIQRTASKLADEAARRADTDARLKWESEQHRRRLRSIQKQERQLRERESRLRKKEELLSSSVGAQSWAERVSTSYSGQQDTARQGVRRRPQTGNGRNRRGRAVDNGRVKSRVGGRHHKEVQNALKKTQYATSAMPSEELQSRTSNETRSTGVHNGRNVQDAEPRAQADNDRDEFLSAVEWASKVQQAYVPL